MNLQNNSKTSHSSRSLCLSVCLSIYKLYLQHSYYASVVHVTQQTEENPSGWCLRVASGAASCCFPWGSTRGSSLSLRFNLGLPLVLPQYCCLWCCPSTGRQVGGGAIWTVSTIWIGLSAFFIYIYFCFCRQVGWLFHKEWLRSSQIIIDRQKKITDKLCLFSIKNYFMISQISLLN